MLHTPCRHILLMHPSPLPSLPHSIPRDHLDVAAAVQRDTPTGCMALRTVVRANPHKYVVGIRRTPNCTITLYNGIANRGPPNSAAKLSVILSGPGVIVPA